MNTSGLRMNGWYSPRQGVVMNKNKFGLLLALIVSALLLTACQANYIRDIQGGTVAPDLAQNVTGVSVQ